MLRPQRVSRGTPTRRRHTTAVLLIEFLLFTLTLGKAQEEQTERPNLTNHRTFTPFDGNGHTLSIDGRVVVSNVREVKEKTNVTTHWLVRVFRPEHLRYDSQGIPIFQKDTFSDGYVLELHNGENALAFCFQDPSMPYRMVNDGAAVYEPYVFDSRMFGPVGKYDRSQRIFRRRQMSIRVRNPFTPIAEVESVDVSPYELLSTVNGEPVKGIEPTLTADGRLMVLQGNPSNNGNGDHLMYSYNEHACAVSGWSTPRILSELHSDTEPGLKNYPLSWKPLAAATGESYDSDHTLLGAYPWLDPEGRNVLYTAVRYPPPKNGRREAVSLIGADTGHKAIHLDGSINESRHNVPKLFFSSPMWQMERERHASLIFGKDNNTRHYLPVTKAHDVLPVFGSNTDDYNEVNIGILTNPYYILYLPMNELVTRAGEYDLTLTPDLSDNAFVGRLFGSAFVTPSNQDTQACLVKEIQGCGKALALDGSGALMVLLDHGRYLEALTVQLLLKPKRSACDGDTKRVVIRKEDLLEVIFTGVDSVQMRLKVGQTWIRAEDITSVPLNAWTHVAWSFDGVAGSLQSYRNGIPAGNGISLAPGTVHIAAGPLWIGAPSTSVSTPAFVPRQMVPLWDLLTRLPYMPMLDLDEAFVLR